MNHSRRKVLGSIAGTVGLMAAGPMSAFGAGLKAVCGTTPTQPEGPFYPADLPLDSDSDLTRVDGDPARAEGQVVYVGGQVSDEGCRPVRGALVEIWQACASGRYDHSSDPNPARLDPHFQYYGRAVTNENGRYLFRTILPGAYPAGAGWTRPPHIHFKVAALGFHELITQMYFEGQPLNGADRILRSIPASQRHRVVVPLREPGSGHEPGSRAAAFDLSLVKA